MGRGTRQVHTMTWKCTFTAYTGTGETPAAAMAALLASMERMVGSMMVTDLSVRPELTPVDAARQVMVYVMTTATVACEP